MRKRDGTPAKVLLAVSLACLLAVLGGCSAGKYEAVSLEALESGLESTSVNGEAEAPGEEAGSESGETMRVLTMDENGNLKFADGASDAETSADGEASADGESEAVAGVTFTKTEDVVALTAEVVNVREEPREDARILVQLKAGSTLNRTGISDEWCQVLYNGRTAYVAAAFTEVYEEPETSDTGSEEAEPAAAAGAAAQAESGGSEGMSADGGGVPEGNADGTSGNPAAGEAEAAGNPAGGDGQTGLDGRPAETRAPEVPFNGHTIAIDAGHQAKANAEKEPIGPGSETMKAKMPAGATGTESGVKECELTLAVAKKLEQALENKGYHVVMIRESNDVNLSSAERSQIANQSEAEILVRLHANSMENSGVSGTLAMCMTDQNPYNAGLHGQSYTLSKLIVDQICGQTGSRNRGVQEVDNLSDINWSEIPVSVVEMGFLSCPEEDRLLQDEAYQDKIAAGISAAIDSYFAG